QCCGRPGRKTHDRRGPRRYVEGYRSHACAWVLQSLSCRAGFVELSHRRQLNPMQTVRRRGLMPRAFGAVVSGCHGLVPWRLTFLSKRPRRSPEMPRPCAVEARGSYFGTRHYINWREAPRLKAVAAQERALPGVDTNMILHGTRPWHQE